MGNILQVRPPNPSISHRSKLAELRATENRRQTKRSLTAQSTSLTPQGPWKKDSAGPRGTASHCALRLEEHGHFWKTLG